MNNIREFNFSGNSVAVTYLNGATEMGIFHRLDNGDVVIGGRRIGHAADPNDTQLVVREYFVNDPLHKVYSVVGLSGR